MLPTDQLAAPPLVTGAQYVAQITARASDRRARTAFQQLVLQLLPAGATLLDFGCGTGLDALFYAQHGYRVLAYDVDARMRAYFAAECAAPLAAGCITLEEGSYEEFLVPKAQLRRVALVTANFAPLSLIGDLAQLFAALHARTLPGARLLASVLNPYFLGDLRYGWWWRNLPVLLGDGHFAVRGAQADIHRRQLRDFAAQCAPYFTLQQVFRGLASRRGAAPRAGLYGRRVSWQLLTCRFLFLLFVRSELQGGRSEHRLIDE